MNKEIPQWVIDYNNAGHQSAAGRAIKLLMDEHDRLQRQLKEIRNKAIDDCIQVLENNTGDMNLVPLLESLKL